MGETRVLFGTDVPFHHPVVEIAKVRVSDLPPEAVDRVLDKNGRLLFFGDENATEPVAERLRPGKRKPRVSRAFRWWA